MDIIKRNASLDDAAILLQWRNNPSARMFASNSELIQIEDHLVWLSERLQRITFEPFYLFEQEQKLVGMSRLDFEFQAPSKFVISVLVDPDQRGKGIGTKILDMTCAAVFDVHSDSTIIANVHKNNSVSQKLFASCGFKLTKLIDDFFCFEKKLN
jgi:RimJ/RimL family protein N-acetyltransferase